MKKILIINGHPDKESFCTALAEAYRRGARSAGADTREITIADLDFNPNLRFGYRKRTDLEPDLLEAWEKIQWADHLVWVYPVWWASVPAIMKGFLDCLFLPGFAFRKKENSLLSTGLLKGKSARLISTLDQPGWFYRWVGHRPSYWAMKWSTLYYCGIRNIRSTTIGPVRLSRPDWRANWLKKIETTGRKLK